MVLIVPYLLISVGILVTQQHQDYRRVNSRIGRNSKSKNISRYFLFLGIFLGVVAVSNIWLLLIWLFSTGSYFSWHFYQKYCMDKIQVKRAALVYQGCHYLNGLLQAGKLPRTALQEVGLANEIFKPVALAAEVGADISDSLVNAANQLGCEKLRLLSQAWRISEVGGNSLALTLEKILLQLRQEQRLMQLIDQELAAAQASGRLLAVLPLVGLVLGFSFGGNPINFLTQNILGRLALFVGVLLVFIGLFWNEKIARSVK